MADALSNRGAASFGNGTLDPAAGNNRLKALLQMLMQKAGQGNAAGGFGSAAGAQDAVGLGGMRATPKNRDSSGQGFTHPAQIAAQFIGGLGVGARGGQSQAGSNGSAVERFLPSGGGPVERHVQGPQSPQAPQQNAPQAPQPGAPAGADPSAPAPAVGTDSGGYTLYQGPNNPTPTVDPGFDMAPSGSTPTSGAQNLIPLGNGAFYDPSTGQVHYPGVQSVAT